MPRDEPGPGGVRVGATRSDLDCRVVATSRCVAPTDRVRQQTPPFWLRLDVSPPTPRLLAATGYWYSIRRAAARTLVCRDLSPTTESDSSDIRRTWGVGGGPTRPTRPTLSVGLLSEQSCHGTRDSSDMPSLENAPDSPPSTSYQAAFPGSMPADSLFIGRSVINTPSPAPPFSKCLKRESSKGPPKLKPSFERTRPSIHNRVSKASTKCRSPESRTLSWGRPPHRSCSAFMRVPYSVHVQQSVWTMC